MVVAIMEPNTCIRGCCWSLTIPLHLNPSSYSLSSPIARGAESVVYEASLDGKRVAVKKPVLSTSDDLDKFHKQLQLLCKLDHPGISKLMAAHARPPNYMFFFEFYGLGSLADKLHLDEWTPRIDQALDIVYQLAKALQYLHNLGIVHRDVKPANILLDRNLHPHLADFGLAEYKKDLNKVSVETWRSSGKPTGGFHKKNMVGTLIYMPPEVWRKEIHTEKSDVFSFGVTVNELLTGVVPYTDLRAAAQAHTVLEMSYTEQALTAAVVSDGLRPILATTGSGAPPKLLSLIESCWDADPMRRPSFDDIVAELRSMLEIDGRKEVKRGITEIIASQDTNKTNFRCSEHNIDWSTLGQDLSERASLAPSGLRNWFDDSQDNPVTYRPVLSWGSFSTCGRRETMEDKYFLMPQLCDERDIHLFGVFDGHRGAAAAEFSASALPRILHRLGSQCSPSNALVEAFLQTDIEFRSELNSRRHPKGVIQKDFHPGCTAATALIVKNKLYVANAGDCRTILCRAGDPYPLSRDHIASCVKERERVISAGGEVRWQFDTWRVGPVALQVTRSIGDDDLKPAVTAEPEITETMLSINDEYMVMASDGLWDVLSDRDVISIIKDTVKEPGMCSKRLATEAAERGSGDNITVITVFLRPVSTAERIY